METFFKDFVNSGGIIDGLRPVKWGDADVLSDYRFKSGKEVPADVKKLLKQKPGQLPKYVLDLAEKCPWATVKIGENDDFVVTLEKPARGYYTFKTQGWEPAKSETFKSPLSTFMKQKLVENCHDDFGLINSDGVSHWKTDSCRYVWEKPEKPWPEGVYDNDGETCENYRLETISPTNAVRILTKDREVEFKVYAKASDVAKTVKNLQSDEVYLATVGTEFLVVSHNAVIEVKNNGVERCKGRSYAAPFCSEQLSRSLRSFGANNVTIALHSGTDIHGGMLTGTLEIKDKKNERVVFLVGLIKKVDCIEYAVQKAENFVGI